MSQPDRNIINNRLLRSLNEADISLILPHLTHIALAKGEPLVEPDQTITHSWFIDSGVASIVLATPQGHQAEIGLVGVDGMVDVATLHGADRPAHRSFVQIAGGAWRISSIILKGLLDHSPQLRQILLGYAYHFLMQVSANALANASFPIEQRLARWLLMCHDRVKGDDVAITHEFLALMLNVRRAGITIAVQTLERAGLIEGRRGIILIADRAGLERFAADSYGATEAFGEYPD